MTNELLAVNASGKCLACTCPSLAIPCQCEEMEWKALEKERAAMGWEYGKQVACGVKHSDKPHPDSYGADLPLRSVVEYSATGARYQLTVPSLAKLTRTTRAERNSLAARPLQLTPCDDPPRHSSHEMSGPAAIERARNRFAELSIVPLI